MDSVASLPRQEAFLPTGKKRPGNGNGLIIMPQNDMATHPLKKHHTAHRPIPYFSLSTRKTSVLLHEMKSWILGALVGMMCYARAKSRSVVVEHAFGPEAEVCWVGIGCWVR